jgi:hypothetical protein
MINKTLVEKSEGKRALEKPNHRWEYTIKVDVKEVGCGDVDFICFTILFNGGIL